MDNEHPTEENLAETQRLFDGFLDTLCGRPIESGPLLSAAGSLLLRAALNIKMTPEMFHRMIFCLYKTYCELLEKERD